MATTWRPSKPAVWGLVLYLGAAAVAGDTVFPISRFTMYAFLDGYEESAVLMFRADGEPVDLTTLRGFSGPITTDIPIPGDVQFSMGFKHDESTHWMATHPAADGETGPVRVEAGYQIVAIGPDGPYQVQAFTPVTEGQAWRR